MLVVDGQFQNCKKLRHCFAGREPKPRDQLSYVKRVMQSGDDADWPDIIKKTDTGLLTTDRGCLGSKQDGLREPDAHPSLDRERCDGRQQPSQCSRRPGMI